MRRRACVAQTLVLGRKCNVRRTKFCEKGKGRGRAAKHLHSVPKTKLVPKNSTKILSAGQWPASYRITMYSHLSNDRGGWNKRVGVQKLEFFCQFLS